MEHSDIEHMAQGYPPSHIGKDCEEVITWLATQLLANQEQRDALADENARMKKAIKRIFPEGVSDEKGGIGFSDASKECYASATKNPATDACLNSLRAEGVEALMNILQVMIDAGDFAGDEVGAITGAIDAGNYYAAKLRAGKDGE